MRIPTFPVSFAPQLAVPVPLVRKNCLPLGGEQFARRWLPPLVWIGHPQTKRAPRRRLSIRVPLPNGSVPCPQLPAAPSVVATLSHSLAGTQQ